MHEFLDLLHLMQEEHEWWKTQDQVVVAATPSTTSSTSSTLTTAQALPALIELSREGEGEEYDDRTIDDRVGSTPRRPPFSRKRALPPPEEMVKAYPTTTAKRPRIWDQADQALQHDDQPGRPKSSCPAQRR
jgi:hypothetical protein